MNKVHHYKTEIMTALVTEFNKARTHDSTRISTEKLYPDYFSGTGDLDFDAFEAFSAAIKQGEDAGLFSATFNPKSNIYTTVTATREQAAKMASMLHLVSRDTYLSHIRTVLCSYQSSRSPHVKEWVSYQLGENNLRQVTSFYRYKETMDIDSAEQRLRVLLDGCEHIYDLTEDILCRNFSVKYYGGSKIFEKDYLNKTAKILAPDLAKSGVPSREILKIFRVTENPTSVLVKGEGTLIFKNGDTIHLDSYTSHISLSKSFIVNLEHIWASAVLSIENLTSFNDFPTDKGFLVVYTGGYANSLVVDFLRKCTFDNDLERISHFGDLDAYGFDILRNLSQRSGLTIHPYQMDLQTYKKHQSYAVPMTKENRLLLKKFLCESFFSDSSQSLFRKLLADNKTLEQESIQNR